MHGNKTFFQFKKIINERAKTASELADRLARRQIRNKLIFGVGHDSVSAIHGDHPGAQEFLDHIGVKRTGSTADMPLRIGKKGRAENRNIGLFPKLRRDQHLGKEATSNSGVLRMPKPGDTDYSDFEKEALETFPVSGTGSKKHRDNQRKESLSLHALHKRMQTMGMKRVDHPSPKVGEYYIQRGQNKTDLAVTFERNGKVHKIGHEGSEVDIKFVDPQSSMPRKRKQQGKTTKADIQTTAIYVPHGSTFDSIVHGVGKTLGMSRDDLLKTKNRESVLNLTQAALDKRNKKRNRSRKV